MEPSWKGLGEQELAKMDLDRLEPGKKWPSKPDPGKKSED